MKFFLSLALLLTSVFFTSLSAEAQFRIGGGCMITNEDGRELCEEDDYANLEEISIEEELSALEALTVRIPGLTLIFEKVAQQREWFLEERAFNPDYCSPQGIAETEKAYDIVACQGPTEVRISKKFWLTANLEQRRDLVLHELMMAYFFERDKSAFHARKATYLILQGIKKDLYKTRTQLHQLGFPLLRIDPELTFFRQISQAIKGDLCAQNIEGIQATAQKFIDASWDVIVVFDPGFLKWVESKINEALVSIESQPQICAKAGFYEKYIELVGEDDIF